ncbi:CDP-diacylglycerol--serine O-phosphatidyltransferase [Segniliparus rugosus]|uniref:CDP-diacylglycerol--serine O-phosphatidyltransferase n=1 Tax=Segniliparus rugosus (strain ATCC BAA-974 / DSM 45345 / CCUG 50838 / CIP 108380 / JCM 13579 / CDC 945) TaxID=679197 RepID=E5XQR9_SEGRC|nr:CDP-diacylglycerol-serine O-phosphatidyltransferase [Segniliparus rugosus ATCC BAA-974]
MSAATSRALRPGVRLLPSVMTVSAICLGLSAAKFAMDGRVEVALPLIAAAAVLDGLDGRVARLLDATSKMGAELDSLADALNFGVSPALVIYIALLKDAKAPHWNSAVGWIAVLLFVVCAVLRLARFNTLTDESDAPAYAKEYFVGVPTPAGALTACAPIAALLQWHDGWWLNPYLVSAWVMFVGLLMISRVPTLALKTVSVPPRLAALLLVSSAAAVAALIAAPYVFLIVLILVYIAHIPFAWRSWRWVSSRPDAWELRAPQRRAMRRAESPRPRVRAVLRPRSARRLGLRRPKS